MRQTVIFMVKNGFSLLELRKLDLSEFYSYVQNTICVGEKRGEIKEGTHSKILGEDNTVNELRKQFMKVKKS